jgi:hypothetical protein
VLASAAPSPQDVLELIVKTVHRVVTDPTEREHTLGHIYGRAFSMKEKLYDDEQLSTHPGCGRYLGDSDATCLQLTCVRDRGHDGLCDNVRGDRGAP